MSPEGKPHYRNAASAVLVEIDQRIVRKKETKLILSWAERSGKILEIGSNLGYFTGRAAEETGSHVVGVDTNTSRLVYKIASFRNKGRSTSFVQGDQNSGLAFKDGSFDQVIMSHVIEHFEDPTSIINEIKRVLKENGTIIVSVPRERFLGENVKDHKVLYVSLDQLRTQLEGYGFEMLKEKDFGLGESAVIKMIKKTN